MAMGQLKLTLRACLSQCLAPGSLYFIQWNQCQLEISQYHIVSYRVAYIVMHCVYLKLALTVKISKCVRWYTPPPQGRGPHKVMHPVRLSICLSVRPSVRPVLPDYYICRQKWTDLGIGQTKTKMITAAHSIAHRRIHFTGGNASFL